MRSEFKKELMTVTSFSKALAGILFILLIFAAFFLGMKFNEQSTETGRNSPNQISK